MSAQNPNLYNVNYQGVETNLTPPNHRTPVWLAWLKALLYPLQWLHNNFFLDYANGSADVFYNYASTYTVGDRVIDIDNKVYECLANIGPAFAWNSTFYYEAGNFATYDGQMFISLVNGNLDQVPVIVASPNDYINSQWWSPTNPHLTPSMWVLVNSDYRGVRPRTLFNSQKLVLEGILNQYFRTTFRQPPYRHITAIIMQSDGSGYSYANATLTGYKNSGIDAVAEPKINSGGEITEIKVLNPGFGYLSPITVNITGDGTGARVREVLMAGTAYPDIFIDNHLLPNSVFTVGIIEAESSVAVFENGEAVDFVEKEGCDYNFDATDFTIFVP